MKIANAGSRLRSRFWFCGLIPAAMCCLFPLLKALSMRAVVVAILFLCASNVFMTFAWYAHLKELTHKPWFLAVLFSWGIAFFEYTLQVPGNRIGHTALSVGQLKILQEIITLSVFVPFAVLYLKEPVKLDYVWAGLCMLGAVYFVFRAG